MATKPNELEDLLSRTEGVRRLARSLVRDEALADDVVQDAWLAALRRPPPAGWAPGAWLSGVVRNLARKSLRSAARRRRREHAVARPEALPRASAADMLARLETQSRLLAAVRALDEPYRTAITLRYFDGRPPRAIALARGVPVATVRSHLRRGLDRLRETLDASHGGSRRSWASGLIPLAARRATDLPPIAMAVTARLAVPVLAALLIVATPIALIRGSADHGGRTIAPEHARVAEIETLDPGAVPSLAARSTTEDAAAPDSSPEGPAFVKGVVVDASGRPLPGVHVEATGELWRQDAGPDRLRYAMTARELGAVVGSAVSDAHGRFTLQGLDDHRAYRVEARSAPPAIGSSISVRPLDAPAGGVRLSVVEGVVVEGRVVGAGGVGVVATVLVLPRTDGPGGWFSTRLRTGVDGRFRAVSPPGAGGSVRVQSEARMRSFAFDGPWTGERLFPLHDDAAAGVRGRTLDSRGEPVARTEVRLEIGGRGDAFDGSMHVAARSGEDGAYVVEGVPAGRILRVEARGPGFVRLAEESMAVPLEPGAVTTLDVRLFRTCTLRGRVLDEAEAPIAGADVRYEAHGPNPVVHRTVTGADGVFSFDDLSPGLGGELGAFAPGRYPVQVAEDGEDERVGATQMPAIAEGATVVRDVVLRRGVEVRGRAVDETGAAVPGALVVARSQAGWAIGNERRIPHTTTTGAGGEFVFEGLPPALDWRFEVRSLAGRGEAEQVVHAEGPPPPLLVRVLCPAAIGGRLLDPDGRPAAGRGVAARRRGGNRIDELVTADAAGRFAFEGLTPGTYDVRASGSSWERSLEVVQRTVGPGERTDDVVLRVEKTFVAEGRVVDGAGKPVARAGVTLREENPAPGALARQSWATTGADGAFRAEGLAPGSYVVDVNGVRSEDRIAAGARGMVVRATSGSSPVVEGIVYAPDGAPCPRCTISLAEGNDNGSSSSQTEVAGGRFRLPRSATPALQGARRWLVVTNARADDGTALGTQPFVLDPIPEGPLEIRLLAGLTLRGRVTSDEGNPMAGVEVLSYPGDLGSRTAGIDPWTWAATTDVEGAFLVRGLPEGDVHLSVGAKPPWIAPEPVVARAGASNVVVRVTRGVDVRGRLVGPDGEPAAGVQVETSDPGHRTTSAPDGSFRLEGLAAGSTVELVVASPVAERRTAYLFTRVPFVRVGGDPIEIRLRRGVFLEGTVVTFDGEAPSGGEVVAEVRWPGTDQPKGYVSARPGPGGAFRVGPVEPGPTRVSFKDYMGRWARSTPLEVVAPKTGIHLLAPRPGVVRGRVAGGGAIVRWNPGEGRDGPTGTEATGDGTFTIQGARDEPGTLYAHESDGDGYALREGVKPSDGPFDLRLEPGASIEGRVEGAGPSHPGERVTVEAVRGAFLTSIGLREDGTFSLRALPPGTYTVRLGWGSWSASADGVAAGARDVVLRARPR